RRRVTFGVLLVLAGVCGVRMATLPESADNSPGALLVAAATSLTCAIWCAFDARVLGKRAPPVLLAMVFLVLPIALPIYFLWSRGLRGILFGIAFAAVFLCAMYAAGFVADFLAESRS
ncbi:MAG TPA: hypothetical protein VF384_06570, partial [Planctomycetota bacterium]